MTVDQAATASSARDVATAVYQWVPEGCDWNTLPDGCESLSLNGWVLRIVNDPGGDAPNGLTWWLDSTVERLVESGGWEVLPLADLDREAFGLAGILMRAGWK